MMRKASTRKALLGLGVLGLLAGLPAAATATPTVTIKAAAVPVPINPGNSHSATYPGTGDILGAPFAVEVEAHIHGTEYGTGPTAGPSPVTGVKVISPVGVKLNSNGFPSCSEEILKNKGPASCPKKSFASPLGEAEGFVSFGSERVHEKVTVQAFFAPGGGLVFGVFGNSPASIELYPHGTTSLVGGHEVFSAEVPLIESVPGALDGSAEFFKVKVGAAYKKGKKLTSYLTAPKTCPKGGFPLKAEISFLSGEVVPAEYNVPCPKHKK
jgi:hypothetical protein